MFNGKINLDSTIGREIQRNREFRPDHPAVVSSGFAPLSYRELQNLIDEIRTNLRLAGFSRNARIGIALANGPQAALAIVAVACSAVAVPLNPKQTVAEIDMCLTALRLDAVLLLLGSDSAARSVAERKGLTIIESVPARAGKLGFKIVAPRRCSTVQPDEPSEPDPDACAFILETSATTSEPKLIPFSHRNMLAAAGRLQAWFNLTSQDRCLSVSPVYYCQGLTVTVFTPLLTGGTVAFPANASEFDSSEWFGALKPTWFTASPTLHHLIFDRIKSRANAKIKHSLRFILSGGAPLPRNIHEGLQHKLGVHLLDHYGASEAAQISTNLLPPGPAKLGTCGIPWPDTVIVAGEDGRRLLPGERGEILVRGPTVMVGYLDAPELNRASFVNGWLKTGDIGSLDEGGFLTLHGRLKDMINRGGEKVWPIEIDDALMRHPAVAEAAAFAMSHPRLGEDVAAAVVLHSGKAATPDELRRYLGQQLAPFKVPRRLIILNQLPKGSTGKVLRRRLSDSLGKSIAVPKSESDAAINGKLLFRLRDLWELLLNSGPLSIDDDFFEKGGDSLLAEEMLIEVERLTGKAVPISNIFDMLTIRQLAKELCAEQDPKPKLPNRSSDGRAPLLFFQSIEAGLFVRKLANLLGPDQPLIQIVPPSLENKNIPLSVEAMAAERLPVIKNAQPHGPYRLAGFCNEGLIAFEAARLLVAAGEKVEMAVMIDPPTVNVRRSFQMVLSILAHARPVAGPIVERAMVWIWYKIERLDGLSNLPFSRRWAWFRSKFQALVGASYDRIFATLRADKPNILYHVTEPATTRTPSTANQTRENTRAYLNLVGKAVEYALSNYFPSPITVPVIIFSAKYNAKAWGRIIPNLEVIRLTGSHESIVSDPTDLAQHLRDRLRKKIETNSN